MIYTSRVGVASPLAGTGYEMYAIAAVVLGGAKLTGGVGKAVSYTHLRGSASGRRSGRFSERTSG